MAQNEATSEVYDNIELDGQEGQDNLPGDTSATNKRKKKAMKDKENDIDKLKGVIYEMSRVIRSGNDSLNDTLREILREGYKYKVPAPQLSGEEIWSMLRERGCDEDKIPNIYCFLMANIDKLRTMVQCLLATRKQVILKMVFGSN